MSPRWLPAGRDAVLLEVGSADEVAALHGALLTALAGEPGLVVDVVPAARTVLLDGVRDEAAVRRLVAGLPSGAADGSAGALPREVEVPVRYDGADLDEVARRWGTSRDEVVATHTGTTFTVAFCGFAPGFAYCTGLPERLHVARLETPRTRVPAGSVGLAGEFTGVYPTASPGGWLLLGRTDLTLFDVAADPPALLAPGTRVRFTAVGS